MDPDFWPSDDEFEELPPLDEPPVSEEPYGEAWGEAPPAAEYVGAAPEPEPDYDLVDLADPHPEPAEPAEPAEPGPGFPPILDLPDLPEPVDGYPWSDADLLGEPEPTPATAPPLALAEPPPLALAEPSPVGFADQGEVSELAAYAGAEPGAGWAELLADDDPATAALARFWAG